MTVVSTSEDIIDTGTAAGIYDLRRQKIKHCAEPVGEARSVLDFCLSILLCGIIDIFGW